MTNLSDTAPGADAPSNSADWRFFLPISAESNVLLVTDHGEDIARYFEKLGIRTTIYNTDSSNAASVKLSAQKRTDFENDFSPPDGYPLFDVVALPHGFPGYFLSRGNSHQINIFQKMKQAITSHGALLVGFSNSLRLGRAAGSSVNSYATPQRMVGLLRKAGYPLVEIYGVIPDLYVPDYIFPLNKHEIGFVLEHRYRYKIPAWLLKFLTTSFVAGSLSVFFPFYYAVAYPDK
ncbi:MAG: hypothetical protein HZB18_13825 [Chloroflexi bacterium]|nr:hypothetical protein [Chloroflexota bacterium]